MESNTQPVKTIPAHPCFDKGAVHGHARVHLPIAPKCNIQCNYCNRKYDCVNESRPGVTSGVLSPFQAVAYLKDLNKRLDNISVIGIAGPGDPFANPEETMKTIELVRREFPEKILCLSTNGLNVSSYIPELRHYHVSHVTITINAIDPLIGKEIYSWVRHEKHLYRGENAAAVLLGEQLRAIALLKENNITVKINSIILPGINDGHFAAIASRVKELGADVMNCIPVFPNKETVFAAMKKPGSAMIKKTREDASHHIGIMSHCARCRADAAGLLGADMKDAFGLIREYASGPLIPEEIRPCIAVATNEGMLVNMHLGEAEKLSIYRQTPKGFQFVEERITPEPGNGDFRWMELSRVISDCRALLVSGIGNRPMEIIRNSGVRIIQMTGLIDEGLEAIYTNKPLKTLSKTEMSSCGNSCRGSAQGCA